MYAYSFNKFIHTTDLSIFCLYLHNLLYKYRNNNNAIIVYSNIYVLTQSVRVHIKI